MVYPVVPAAERFAARFEPELNTGCWLWTAGLNNKGYGVFPLGGDAIGLAHRYSYELHRGPIPKSGRSCVCHRCDTRACVNPAHLFLGSNADNTADKVAKGRQLRGETNPAAKLSASDVRAIRVSAEAQSALAKRYGVSQPIISRILSGRIWAATI